jgi:hypothetical protein
MSLGGAPAAAPQPQAAIPASVQRPPAAPSEWNLGSGDVHYTPPKIDPNQGESDKNLLAKFGRLLMGQNAEGKTTSELEAEARKQLQENEEGTD